MERGARVARRIGVEHVVGPHLRGVAARTRGAGKDLQNHGLESRRLCGNEVAVRGAGAGATVALLPWRDEGDRHRGRCEVDPGARRRPPLQVRGVPPVAPGLEVAREARDHHRLRIEANQYREVHDHRIERHGVHLGRVAVQCEGRSTGELELPRGLAMPPLWGRRVLDARRGAQAHRDGRQEGCQVGPHFFFVGRLHGHEVGQSTPGAAWSHHRYGRDAGARLLHRPRLASGPRLRARDRHHIRETREGDAINQALDHRDERRRQCHHSCHVRHQVGGPEGVAVPGRPASPLYRRRCGDRARGAGDRAELAFQGRDAQGLERRSSNGDDLRCAYGGVPGEDLHDHRAEHGGRGHSESNLRCATEAAEEFGVPRLAVRLPGWQAHGDQADVGGRRRSVRGIAGASRRHSHGLFVGHHQRHPDAGLPDHHLRGDG
mmetsp:Transcript_69940/g.202905  ORF Transcript_69940/g.202905 Transcript_69940/m.202905 type:complete len:434 (+) Transcript_69940:542-1843(+)